MYDRVLVRCTTHTPVPVTLLYWRAKEEEEKRPGRLWFELGACRVSVPLYVVV